MLANAQPPVDFPYERSAPRYTAGLISPDSVWRLEGGFPDWTVVNKKTGEICKVSFSKKRIRKAFGDMATYFGNNIWLPDSKGWVTIVHTDSSMYAVKFSLKQRRIVETLPLKYPRGTLGWPDMFHHRLLGVTRDKSVLVLSGLDNEDGFPHRMPTYYLYSFRFGRREVPSWSVYPPSNKAFLYAPVYSPEKDALAWTFYDERQPQSCDIYLSDIHGAKMRLVLHLAQSPETSMLYKWRSGTFFLYNRNDKTGRIGKSSMEK